MRVLLPRIRFACAAMLVDAILWVFRFTQAQRRLTNFVLVCTSANEGRVLVAGRYCSHMPVAVVMAGAAGRVEAEADAVMVAHTLLARIQGANATVN